jgi:hypothetical protein
MKLVINGEYVFETGHLAPNPDIKYKLNALQSGNDFELK